MNPEAIRLFAISKLRWIRQQQKKVAGQEREPEREYLERESHYVWGKRFLLKVVEKDEAPVVELQHNRLVLQIRPGYGEAKRQEILDAWYRAQVKVAVPALLAKWEPLMGVRVERFFVQRMKTKWGVAAGSRQVSGSIRIWRRSHGSAWNIWWCMRWRICWSPRIMPGSRRSWTGVCLRGGISARC
jgi:predicted metal-dependent hydrolase